MNRIKILLSILCLSLPILLNAKDIDKNLLVKYACNAYQMKQGISADAKAVLPSVSDIQYVEEKGQTLMAIVNFDDEGFIIISADDATKPVLAYSNESTFDWNNLAPATLYWMDYLKAQLLDVKRNHLEADKNITAEWKAVMSGKAIPSLAKGGNAVAPLIAATWNQNKYYNHYCPEDSRSPSGYDGRVPCGCLALAMSMIMYYYNFPAMGSGSHTYTSNYGTHTVNFTTENFHYEMMQDVLTNYNHEVAKLIYDAGVSIDMNYAPEGSGAYITNACKAMVDNFSFSPDASVKYRSYFNNPTWVNDLKVMIDAGQPILYCGCSRDGCHAFICDGYDTTGLFHFNWGWGGQSNGYFEADKLNGGVGDYGSSQSIINNLYPSPRIYPPYCSTEKIIPAVSGVLTDGSGNFNYKNNQDCSYIFAPADAIRFNFKVLSMDTEEGQDSVSIWKGHPSKGQLVKTFSGNHCNKQSVDFIADTVYLTFKTNDSITGAGWRISYNISRDIQMCVSNKILRDNSGVIGDGSGEKNYASNASCSWLIYPKGASAVQIRFNKFDISPEDVVAFYDVNSNKLLASFSGSEIPKIATYRTNRLKLVFSTDNYLERDGFELTYTGLTGTSIESMTIEADNLTIYPNPAQNKVNIHFPDTWKGDCQLAIYDLAGKLLKSEVLPADETAELNVNDLSAGLYLLKATNANSTLSKKLVIQK